MLVTKSITPVPNGVNKVRLYYSYTQDGIYTFFQDVDVSPGDTEITFDAEPNRFYKFSFVSASGRESLMSSATFIGSGSAGTRCVVFDYLSDGSSYLNGVEITAVIASPGVVTADGVSLAQEPVRVISGDAGNNWEPGYWQIELYRSSALIPVGAKYLIKRKGNGFDDAFLITIPDQDVVDFNDLI